MAPLTPPDLEAEYAREERVRGAAPELLSALRDAALIINGMANKTLPACFTPKPEFVDAMNAAIAKAEGRTQ